MISDEKQKHPTYIFVTSNGREVFINTFEFDIGSMQYFLRQGKCQLPSTGLLREYNCALIFNDTLYAGTKGGEICIFNIFSRIYKGCVPVSAHGIWSLLMVEDCLYVGGGDGKVKKITTAEGGWSVLSEVQLDGKIMALSPAIDNKEILCGTSNGTLFRLLTADLSYMVHSESHIAAITDLAFGFGVNEKFATIDQAVYYIYIYIYI